MTAFPKLSHVVLERRKSTLIATFNRPEAKNALCAAMVESLLLLCGWLEENRDVRALVLRGAGGTFCAGGDIKDFSAQLASAPPANGGDDPVVKANRRFGELLLRLDALPQVVIAVVEGAAFGGAIGFLSVADIVLAEEGAKFSLSETTLGLPPAQIGPFLVRRIGLFNARRLALTGARFGAEEAWHVGLVLHMEPEEELDATLASVLNQIGKCEPGANAVTKKLFNAAHAAIDPALLDSAARDFAGCLRGKGREGAAAFAAKKQPGWVEAYVKRGDA